MLCQEITRFYLSLFLCVGHLVKSSHCVLIGALAILRSSLFSSFSELDFFPFRNMKLFLALASLSAALVAAEDGACFSHVNVSHESYFVLKGTLKTN